MSNRTLGVDLGPNSIGWALLDEEERRIIATGVRVFPEGVNRDQNENEQPKNQTRREKRGQRRQIARRARRKQRMTAFLQSKALLPEEAEALETLLFENPYELRSRGLDEPLSLHQLGRAILHLNQRRGFLSNRKSDKARQKETSDMLNEIGELEKQIQEGGFRTLGEYLANLQTESRERVRAKHTRRDMYEHELAALWESQKRFHPNELSEDLYREIHKTMFFQRPMYWPESAIGRCSLEPKEKRCPRADRLAQRFRLVQEVNNLSFLDVDTGEERTLSAEELKTIIEFLSTSKEKTFVQIRKKLGFLESCQFNFENAKRKKLKGNITDSIFSHKNFFGKKWFEIGDGRKNEIVACIQDDKISDDDFLRKAKEEWGVDEELAERLMGVNLPDGYMSFSRKAMEKMLPYMERGMPLMSDDDTPSAMSEAGYLRPDQRPVKIYKSLPKPPDLPNPIVRQVLFEFRKLMNAIIREHGKPERIHIELARDVKKPKHERERILNQNVQRRKMREKAVEEIEALGEKPTGEKIAKYLLWDEQDHRCVYSGKPISITQLYGGQTDVDHILPYSRTLDNSMQNRIVCFREANQEKGDATPYEWLSEKYPKRYEHMQQNVRCLNFRKRRKFTQKKIDLGEFVERQLKDTQYISREVTKYLTCLGTDIVCTKGQATSDLRRMWGLNTVLHREGLNIKNREDHRHHAVDAVVVALTTRSRLQQLARSQSKTGNQVDMPHPWNHFWEDVRDSVNAINVSHRVQRKIRGALHEETIYGPTNQEGVYVYRKKVEDLTPNMIAKIRDEGIKRIIIDRLKFHNITLGKGYKPYSKSVWNEPESLKMPSGVPIKKVRIVSRFKIIVPIWSGSAYVLPKNNHHVSIFEKKECKENKKRYGLFSTMIEVAQRIRLKKQSLILKNDQNEENSEFIMSLSINEMLLINNKEKIDLYRIRKLDGSNQRIFAVHHTYAGKAGEISKKNVEIDFSPSKCFYKKVTVDRLGRIRDAND